MKALKFIFANTICLYSLNALAAGGSFTCYTDTLGQGKDIFIQGDIDGEMQVLEAYLMVDGGDDNRTDLTVDSMSIDANGFKAQLNVVATSNPVLPIKSIDVKAPNGDGKSFGNFEITYESTKTATASGLCWVTFEAGI